MRNPDRIQPTLDKLAEIWKEHPDFRLGQLIMVIAMTGEHNPNLFNMEDDVFLRQLEESKLKLNKIN
ncbi:MAG: DUF1040 family protein [Bacteroidetes bacterium]|nr:DUF1040 family protein [Bacteroidota bacterium]